MANSTSIQSIIHENSTSVSNDILRFDYDDDSLAALEEYINSLTQNCDVFFHNFDLSGDTQILQRVESIFDKGLMKTNRCKGCASFLSTMCFVDNEKYSTGEVKNISECLKTYNIVGPNTIIVAIPKKFRDIYFGYLSSEDKKRFKGQATGLQDEKVIPLDFLDLNALPSEFIVGAFCRNSNSSGKFYANKNFLLNELSNPDKNYASLKQKLGLETNLYRWLFDLSLSDKESAKHFERYMQALQKHNMVNGSLIKFYEARLAENSKTQAMEGPKSQTEEGPNTQASASTPSQFGE